MPSAPPTLSVSLVTYRGDDRAALRDTLVSLGRAAQRALRTQSLARVSLHVVDNGSDSAALDRLVADSLEGSDVVVRTHRGHGNVGFGRGHNLAIQETSDDFHLVLNPDVVIDADAFRAAAAFFRDEPQVGLIAPLATDGSGAQLYLCKDYPSIFVLLLRTAAPEAMRRRYRTVMDRYELRDRVGQRVDTDIPLASGCFMFARAAVLRKIGGFSPQYFLYFEDHDLSLRLRRHARIAYVPSVRIVHFGGNASRKGWRHVRLYVRSAAIFFSTHGWRLA